MIDNRSKDTSQEKIVNSVIFDTIFKGNYAELVSDIERQIAGIDIVYKDQFIDLKAQSSPKYLNNPRDTFILEISFKGRDHFMKPGWFMQKDLKTTHYGFIWIPKAKVDEKGWLINRDSIEEFEIMLVSKQALKDYIHSYVTDAKIIEIADKMRSFGMNVYNEGPLKFRCSPEYFEQPVNIVVPKGILKSKASKDFYCKKVNNKFEIKNLL